MNRRFLTALPIGAAVLAAAVACGSSNGSADPVPSIFSPTATQVQAAESAGQQLLARCQPKGDTTTAWEIAFVFHPKATTTALEDCENVPAAKRQALATCVLGAAKDAYKAGGSKAEKEASFVNATATCVRAAQGVTASPTAVPSASASASK
jgi:hypothetical protein